MLAKIQRAWDVLRQHLNIWRLAYRVERDATGTQASVMDRSVYPFLPARLEAEYQPASPTGRLTAWLIMALFGGGILWSIIGKVDVIAVATGKVIPSSYTKVIQPLETARIKAIHVQEGQHVKEGDVLIELDATQPAADVEKYRQDLQVAQLDVARLQALLEEQSSFIPPAEANPDAVATHTDRLIHELRAYQTKRQAAEHDVAVQRAAIRTTQATITKLETSLEAQTDRARSFQQLADQGFVPRLDALTQEQQRKEFDNDIVVEQQRSRQSEALLDQARSKLESLEAEFRHTHQAEFTDAQRRSAELTQELTKAQQRHDAYLLTAPINGVIQQVTVHTIDGVVTPAQSLMSVVPQDDALEIEAWIENKDSGFVHPGQHCEVKVESYPFTIYGTMPGEVISISSDAVQQDNPQRLVYLARIRLISWHHSTTPMPLSPGMSMTAEIHTDQRRLIQYVLSPLLQALSNSFHER